ncbi:MAG: AmmeMemoRadiSam system protein A [Candidatus Woesearchaeota archaeon]
MKMPQSYNIEEKIYMVKLVKETIKKVIHNENIELPSDCPQKLKEKGACFVTIEKFVEGKKHLRGCIGTLFAYRPLIEDLIENSINAAFYDPRFPPLSSEELKNIEVEISILTNPKMLKFSGYKELLEKLNPPQDGVILSKSGKRATFLPSVWEHFKTDTGYYKEGFLTELCLKAGLMPSAWREEGCEIQIYHSIIIKESELRKYIK